MLKSARQDRVLTGSGILALPQLLRIRGTAASDMSGVLLAQIVVDVFGRKIEHLSRAIGYRKAGHVFRSQNKNRHASVF